MKFELLDKIIITNIDGNNYLVDSGSNLSFSLLDKNLDLYINGKKYILKPNIASYMVKDALSYLIPEKEIAGLVGTDLMIDNNLTTIDYFNNEIYFGVVNPSYDNLEKYSIPFKVKFGYIFIDMDYCSKKISMIVDSGAKIGYVKSQYLDLSNQLGIYEDYSPELGKMEGALYSFYDSIHKENVLVGKLPSEYELVCDGIIPLNDFTKNGYCVFDFKNMIFSFIKKII